MRYILLVSCAIMVLITTACNSNNINKNNDNFKGIVIDKKGTTLLIVEEGTKEDVGKTQKELLNNNRTLILLQVTEEQSKGINVGDQVQYLATDIDDSNPASGKASFIEVIK